MEQYEGIRCCNEMRGLRVLQWAGALMIAIDEDQRPTAALMVMQA